MKRLLLIFLFLPVFALAQVITAGAPVSLSSSSSGGGGPPTGAAGGVLSGTYPNPGFAASPTFTGVETITNNVFTPAAGAGVELAFAQVDGTGNSIQGDSALGAGLSLVARSVGGTLAAPTGTPSGTTVFQAAAQGYANGAYTGTKAYLAFKATNLWTAADNSTNFVLGLTPSGSITRADVLAIGTDTATAYFNLSPTVRAAGVFPYFNITQPADTSITAATEGIGFRTTSATRTWATTGTVALQREVYFAAPTYASAGASQTFTDVFNLYVDKPIVGTNAVFTRPHTLGVVDATSAASSITGGLVVATTLGTSATSVGIGGGNVNAGGLITGGTVTSTGALTAGATSITGAAGTTALTVAQTARTSGVLPYIKWTIPTDTAQTTATESPGVLSVTGTRTWAAGTVALQREINFVAPTYATATFTEAATLNISGAPISGTGAAETTTNAVLIAAGAVNGAGTAPVTANSLKILNPTGASGKNFAILVGTAGTAVVNIRHGITTALVGGTLAVTDTASTANTRYFLTAHTLGTVAVPSAYYVSARSAGATFTITASAPTDTSTIDWLAIEP